jgi:DNA-binding NarL/FixJ family response regulator
VIFRMGSTTLDSSGQVIRVLIADDHPATRAGLRVIVESEGDLKVVAEAADGHEAVALFSQHRPDLVLIDLQMPNLNGLEAITRIRREQAAARIVVLTSYPGDARVARALAAGAISYMLKTARTAALLTTLREAFAGRSVLDRAVKVDSSSYPYPESLSEREIAVLKLASCGHQNTQIASVLNVTEHAIKARMKRILCKLAARDRTHAVTIARHRGFLDC